jgi:hypothetical protein
MICRWREVQADDMQVAGGAGGCRWREVQADDMQVAGGAGG